MRSEKKKMEIGKKQIQKNKVLVKRGEVYIH